MKDLLGDEIPPETKYPPAQKGYAAPPGSAQNDKTCGDCDHYRSVRSGIRPYPKCYLVKHAWTCGPGSDIKKSSPACRLFNYIESGE